MMFRVLLLAWAIGLCTPASALAEVMPLAEAAKLFGARETAWGPELSPSGRSMIYLASGAGGRTVLNLHDFSTHETTELLSSTGKPERLDWCDFATEGRIVCEFSGNKVIDLQMVTFSRLIAISTNGKDIKPLGTKSSAYDAYIRQYDGAVIDWLPEQPGSVLVQRNYVPQVEMGMGISDRREGLGVDRIDLMTLKSTAVEPANGRVASYLTDDHGQVRIMALDEVETGNQLTGLTEIRFRRPGSREWAKFGTYDEQASTGCWPVALDDASNSVYCLENVEGRNALFAVKLDGTLSRRVVARNDTVDIDGIVRLDRGMPVIGYSFTDDRSHVVYFDPDYRKLADSLSAALPDSPLIYFASASFDRNLLLVHASSDKDPGAYFLLNRKTRQMEPVLLSRDPMEGRHLAPMRAVTYPASDGTSIPAYVTVAADASSGPKPAIVLPHGGPSARDDWGFDWLAQFLAARGYVVVQPNYRGSSGYGSDFLGENAFRDWRKAMSDIEDAAAYLVKAGLADPRRMAVVGWSYGGYAALQSAVMHPDRYKAVVAIAPVTDFNALKREARGYTNARLVKQLIGSADKASEGSPLQNSDRIAAPVLLVHGTLDSNVGYSESVKMDSALKRAGKQSELLTFKDLDHQLNDSDARTQMLTKIGELLERTIGH